MDPLIIVYRLDTERGHEVQFWPFEGKTLIRIGRALDNDMVFAHPSVSRTQVYLKHDDGGWRAFSISPQGIYDGGTRRTELPLTPGTVFRLGRSGPVLRFGARDDAELTLPARSGSPDPRPLLTLDEQQRHRDPTKEDTGAFRDVLEPRPHRGRV